MWRYLKAAFHARPDIPGLGRLPVNLIALIGLTILGFGHPGFWLLGAGGEAAYLAALATNRRFRRLIDAQDLQLQSGEENDQRRGVIETLSEQRRARLASIEARCAKVIKLHQNAQTDGFVVDGNREALAKLQWLYLKLLVAEQNLENIQTAIAEEHLRRQIEEIAGELRDEDLTRSLRESKEATLHILEKRLTNLNRREESLEEIGSDLVRIEAQIDLALENAGMRGGQPETISANIKLVSHLLDDSVFGDSSDSITALDRTFGTEDSQAQ